MERVRPDLVALVADEEAKITLVFTGVSDVTHDEDAGILRWSLTPADARIMADALTAAAQGLPVVDVVDVRGRG